jgi:ribosomal protein S18 acetylase RimI-like enzyme
MSSQEPQRWARVPAAPPGWRSSVEALPEYVWLDTPTKPLHVLAQALEFRSARLPIVLRQFTDPSELASAELRDRVKFAGASRRFVALLEDGTEAAYVALDVLPDRCVLYELWVRRNLRERGIGSDVARATEDVAQELGRRVLTVRPSSLDGSQLERLLKFYLRLGYSVDPGDPELLNKTVGP